MRVGFVGLGAMGLHMARNLHRAGLLAAVWNRSAEKARALGGELNVAAPATLEQLASLSDAVVCCVSADADVLEVTRGLAPGLKEGALLLDCSTVGAGTARKAAALLAPRGAEFLDCPVSGGVEGARDATLAIMVGGPDAAFARAAPILQALGRTIAHFGPTGSGQAAKATNQIMCAGIIEAIAEAMAFARAQGLPLDKLIETLGKGAGSSWYFVHRAPNMVRGSYPPGFRVRLHAKDLGICHDMAARFGVALPVVERMLAEYAELTARGYGDEDISATYRLKAELFERTNIMGAPTRGDT
ncbi:MAG TPA: NAD(P)-dependent oxidoreductase [Steroidobacteraceae bacterium]|jgi:3-hydroxyisobutyrate dehydrogenase|nr:NAD(P)-dependent oxidoreductase [Steroidobacteraceae bacterium]